LEGAIGLVRGEKRELTRAKMLSGDWEWSNNFKKKAV